MGRFGIRLSSLLFSCLLFVAPNLFSQNVPLVCDGSIYFTHVEDNNTNIWKFNENFEFELFVTTSVRLNAIAFNHLDNFLYAFEGGDQHIHRIDQNGDLLDLGVPTGIESGGLFAGTIAEDGTYILTGSPNAPILQIDLTTSPPTVLTSSTKYFTDGNSGSPTFGDISIEPSTGLCHGFDNTSHKMAIIDPATGAVTTYGNSDWDIVVAGANFFLSSGDLYSFVFDELFKVDGTTGAFNFVVDGPSNQGSIDACTCPYYVHFTKTTDQLSYCDGDTILYTFEIINESSQAQTGINFEDDSNNELTFIANPEGLFGGTIPAGSGVGTSTFSIENMTIPSGTSSFSIPAIVNQTVNNPLENSICVSNQARLSGFPKNIPNIVLSDDPTTFQLEDPTIVKVHPYPAQDLVLDVESPICEGTTWEVFSSSSSDGEVSWSGPEGFQTLGASFEIQNIGLEQMGEYQFSTTVLGCSFDSTFTLEVWPKPSTYLGKDTLACLRDVVTLDAGIFAAYEWSDGATSPDLDIEDYGQYSVQIWDENDCTAIDTINVWSNCASELYIPNAFSPNADGFNDIYYIYGFEVLTFELQIYNRWGALMFQSNDIGIGWDGYFKGKLMDPGIYTVQAKASFINGDSIIEASDVLLVR